jgi:hypothetical protein
MPAPSHNNRAEALRSLALRLRADALPYYLHTPRGPAEPAPGWYWRPYGAAHPVYLAHNHLDAYAKLRRLLDEQQNRQRGDTGSAAA